MQIISFIFNLVHKIELNTLVIPLFNHTKMCVAPVKLGIKDFRVSQSISNGFLCDANKTGSCDIDIYCIPSTEGDDLFIKLHSDEPI